MTLLQILAICGMLSPIIYTVMWILGGYLQPEYSHIRQDISSLVAVDAPDKKLLDKFIISSSTLLFIFYLGLYWWINGGTGLILGPLLLVISGLLGVLVAVFFPLDAGGELITTRAKLHLGLIANLMPIVPFSTHWVANIKREPDVFKLFGNLVGGENS